VAGKMVDDVGRRCNMKLEISCSELKWEAVEVPGHRKESETVGTVEWRSPRARRPVKGRSRRLTT